MMEKGHYVPDLELVPTHPPPTQASLLVQVSQVHWATALIGAVSETNFPTGS